MKRILISYWREINLIDGLLHNSKFEYSIEKQNEIIQLILNNGLSVMLRPNQCENNNTLIIYISKNKFNQS
jgi:hypothetical protein